MQGLTGLHEEFGFYLFIYFATRSKCSIQENDRILFIYLFIYRYESSLQLVLADWVRKDPEEK
jgi:hypothetical protein